ncbi:MAG: lysophospholipase L1-like esterase [Crocinitomicaceae bacterium]|jgi:lysophospholipase L1-like esterase
MNWETLLSFGDSITFGARSYFGYPEICGSTLEKKLSKSWNIINHSTNGFTTVDLIRSLNPCLQGYKSEHPSIITIMIGTNDIKNKTSLNVFIDAYKQIIVKARLMAVNDNIVLFKIPRFTKEVFYPYNFEMNSQVEAFNTAIEELAVQNGLRTIELELDDDDFFDGVHFSTKGSNSAAQQLANFILKDKGFESSSNLS